MIDLVHLDGTPYKREARAEVRRVGGTTSVVNGPKQLVVEDMNLVCAYMSTYSDS